MILETQIYLKVKVFIFYEWISIVVRVHSSSRINVTIIKLKNFYSCKNNHSHRTLAPKSNKLRNLRDENEERERERERESSRCQRNDRIRVFTILRPRDRRPRWQLADSSILVEGREERECEERREREDDQ